MNKYNKFLQKSLDKLFQAVGFDKFDENFAQQENWYHKKTWSLEQEACFKQWFVDEIKKDLNFTKTMAEKEHAWFNLKWGWKTQL
jgi:hypothetical protein